MNIKDNFYIGWQPKMANSNKKRVAQFVTTIIVLVLLLSAGVVYFQRPFNEHTFEYGKLTTIEGMYYSNPVPMLVVDDPSFPKTISPNVLLVGYGKFGAEGIIMNSNLDLGGLDGARVVLKGTLIYGDGKTLLELTEQERSLIKVIPEKSYTSINNNEPKSVALVGEILDPKCYFGVMKPGEGKIHKSCAIRCISGGIPPVFRVRSKSTTEYYILLDENGEKVNKEMLPYVGERVDITGRAKKVNGWNVLCMKAIKKVK
jgi:hypothetical protein